MTRYHWLVLVLCALGGAFGCFGLQLLVLQWTSTTDLLLGWAVGGIFFGILGDKYGRSRMMFWAILLYSVFTGLSGLSTSLWDFLLFRFLAGLGIGGQLVVVIALVSETMPDRMRPYALGFLQLFAVFGILVATFLSMGVDGNGRIVCLFGTFPAVLAYFVIRYLDEPEQWKLAVRDQDEGHKRAGLFQELFGPPHRRRTILAMILTSTGVIGLGGIVFFGGNLCRSVGHRLAAERLKARGEPNYDIAMIGMLVAYPVLTDDTSDLDPKTLLGTEKNNADVRYPFEAIRNLRERKSPITEETVADEAVNRWNLAEGKGRQSSAIPLDEVQRRKAFFLGRVRRITTTLEESERAHRPGMELWKLRRQELADTLQRIDDRTRLIENEATGWRTTASLLMSIGALFGTFAFTAVAVRFGRRLMFTIFMTASILSVLGVFLFANGGGGIYVPVPTMGFFLSALFAGYMIYLPELFPTRIRNTAISFCYGVGFFVAALFIVPMKYVYTMEQGVDDPIRWAGAAMGGLFLIGITVAWMLPETKDKPLPE